ncbi:hypothetical protein STAQ_15510 [Allostella sp. ATCC 35155]|nr:hypothetical protein STAQ_15510 [Stella sp. ATCC 35155]
MRALLAVLLLGTLAAPAAAQTACAPQCIQSYQQRGLPVWEARRVCGCNSGPTGTAALCVTPVGSCRMSAPAQAGTACICATPQGPVAGRAR